MNENKTAHRSLGRTAKVLIVVFSVLVAFALAAFLTIYFMFLHHYKGKNVVNEWNKTDSFSISQIATVEKQKDKDFVILNLADVQMCDLENFFNKEVIHKEISYLVEQTKPDLITLTGDQTWSNENLICLKSLISWLDSYKIPYAPVFGNHDYGNKRDSAVAGVNYCCDLYEKGKYSLFKRGPSNIGSLGNYVVNIVEDGKIYKTLYMIDLGYEENLSRAKSALSQSHTFSCFRAVRSSKSYGLDIKEGDYLYQDGQGQFHIGSGLVDCFKQYYASTGNNHALLIVLASNRVSDAMKEEIEALAQSEDEFMEVQFFDIGDTLYDMYAILD